MLAQSNASGRSRTIARTVAWACVALGIAAATLGSYASHAYALEERSIAEERSRLVVSRPYAGSLATLGLIALAVPVLVLGGDAGAERLHAAGTDVAVYRDKEERLAREENARRWAAYWSSVSGERTERAALECRVPEPPSPEQCLESTSDALQPQWERARRNESRSSWGAAGGGGLVLAGAIGALLFRRRYRLE